ncbi:MAG TPA: VOC family protein [Micromonosporaceae bacterium]|nr:VOC family protein [Micromonosporaceae bacterium]
MGVARHGVVTLDCADARPLADFWAAMLDGEIVYETETTVLVRTEWLALGAMVIPDYEPPTWPAPDVPKQIHLDLAVDDLEGATAEARRLGAVPASVQPAPDRRCVMLDPAGHPFCLTTQVPRGALPV